ncbi:phosphoribulokinase [Serratia marcescens]|nr:phosphoribulokinase [Serratia marcescens]
MSLTYNNFRYPNCPLEPTLTWDGYRLKDMVEQFDAKPAEIRALVNNQLDPARTVELDDRMLAVGLPI